ncbi:unnamed protein product [Calypogeia fissa]
MRMLRLRERQGGAKCFEGLCQGQAGRAGSEGGGGGRAGPGGGQRLSPTSPAVIWLAQKRTCLATMSWTQYVPHWERQLACFDRTANPVQSSPDQTSRARPRLAGARLPLPYAARLVADCCALSRSLSHPACSCPPGGEKKRHMYFSPVRQSPPARPLGPGRPRLPLGG